MELENDYYVYVYIDPRNFEEFYYGKGKGSRRLAHLSDESDSKKAKRIKAIMDENLSPVIKVIARGLTESEAFLVEKTLLWKLGRSLDNVSSGHFADKFRPHDKMHLKLPGFDFKNGIFYVNVGEGDHRQWADCRKYGFLAAGQGTQWSDAIKGLEKGDIVVAFLKGRGYVGVGKVLDEAVSIINFNIDGIFLSSSPLTAKKAFENAGTELAEFLVKIQWIKAVDSSEAFWERKYGLFSTPLVKASLSAQPKTLTYIQEVFEIDLDGLLSDNF